ncbi:hypothetical protein H4V99_002982 [Cryobacterium sp. CG_9.6]|nr:hypothetical protein [Cryobacterium sp. CG_9.6]
MAELTDSNFRAVVDASTWNMARLKDVSVQGFRVRATFKSASGKQTWEADYSFDKETGDLQCRLPYTDSAQAWIFGENIQIGVREILGRP